MTEEISAPVHGKPTAPELPHRPRYDMVNKLTEYEWALLSDIVYIQVKKPLERDYQDPWDTIYRKLRTYHKADIYDEGL